MRFFRDDRYIKEEGKPILLIYKPELINHFKLYINILRQEIKDFGFDVKIGFQYPDALVFGNYIKYCDFYVEFEPSYVQKLIIKNNWSYFSKSLHALYHSSELAIIRNHIKRSNRQNTLKVLSYDEAWNLILSHKVTSEKAVAGGFVDWDNTPRK